MSPHERACKQTHLNHYISHILCGAQLKSLDFGYFVLIKKNQNLQQSCKDLFGNLADPRVIFSSEVNGTFAIVHNSL